MYAFVHALALLGIASLARGDSRSVLRIASACCIAGVMLFSGSLYALALGAPRWLGTVTPIGGLALLAMWLLLAVACYTRAISVDKVHD